MVHVSRALTTQPFLALLQNCYFKIRSSRRAAILQEQHIEKRQLLLRQRSEHRLSSGESRGESFIDSPNQTSHRRSHSALSMHRESNTDGDGGVELLPSTPTLHNMRTPSYK